MKKIVLSLLCAQLAFSADTGPLRGFSNDGARTQREWEAKFRAIPDPANLRAYMQRLARAPAPRRLALRQGQRRVDSREVQGVGPRRADRDLRRALPDAEGARCWNWWSPRASPPSWRSPRSPGDPTSAQQRRATADLQRLLHRWRRHRAAGLRELRRARGLREARPPGHLREGRHRDRALRRLVARHQAQGRGRARRGRLPDLFRSARRRLFRRATSFPRARTAPQTACSAAASWTCRSIPAIR